MKQRGKQHFLTITVAGRKKGCHPKEGKTGECFFGQFSVMT